jgi:hypothetical protein
MQYLHLKTANNYIFLLFSIFSFSQTIKDIKERDTVFIYFKNQTIYEKKTKPFRSKSDFINGIINYSFELDFYNTIFFC